MLNFNFSNKKAVSWLIAGSISLVVWLILYFNYASGAKKINQDINKGKQEIARIKQLLLDVEQKREQEKKSRQLYQLFPKKEEDGLRQVFNLAKSNRVEIITVEPRCREVFKDRFGQKIMYQNKSSYQVVVDLKLKSSYADLLAYLKALDQALSGFISCERILIKSNANDNMRRDVELEFKIYVLS